MQEKLFKVLEFLDIYNKNTCTKFKNICKFSFSIVFNSTSQNLKIINYCWHSLKHAYNQYYYYVKDVRAFKCKINYLWLKYLVDVVCADVNADGKGLSNFYLKMLRFMSNKEMIRIL